MNKRSRKVIRGRGFNAPTAIVSFCLLLVAAEAGANNVTWVKDADGSWTQATNWSSNPTLPGAGDDVTIDVAGDRLITLSGGGTQTIGSLVSAERLLITNSSLSISTTLQISNTLTLNNDGSLQGGTYTASGGAALTVYRGALVGVTANAPISVPGVNGGQLTVSGGLTLNDTLSVGDGGKSYYANLAFGDLNNTADQTLAGTGSVVFNAGYLYAPSGAGTLTIGPGITVRGKNGEITGGAVVNQGTITADGADQRIYLEPTTFTNRGAMSARNGGFLSVEYNFTNAAGASVTAAGGSTLRVGGGSYPWSNAGTITATDSTVYLGGIFTQAGLGNFVRSGGTVNVDGALSGGLALTAATGSWNLTSNGTLAGGTYTATGGAGLTVYRGSLTGGVTVNAPISVPGSNGGKLTVSGGLTLNDTLSVGDGNVSYYGNLLFGGSANQTLGGAGSVVFNNGSLAAPSGAGTLTVARGITVRGQNGTITGNAVVNQGTIAADGAGDTVYVNPTTLTNQGTLQAAGGTLNIATQNFTNAGTMSIVGGGTLAIGGKWTNSVGATITATGSTVTLGSGNNPWSNAGTITATDSTVNLGGSISQADLGLFGRSGGTVNLNGTLSSGLTLSATTGSWVLAGGTLQGGAYSASGDATLRVDSGLIVNVTANAPINVASSNPTGATLNVYGDLTLNSAMTVGNPDTHRLDGYVYFNDIKNIDQTLTGTGTVLFNGGYLNGPSGARLTIGSGITIHGSYAEIHGKDVNNQGTISADGIGQIVLIPLSFTNQGTLSASGGTLVIASQNFTNSGILKVDSGTLAITNNNTNFAMAPGSKVLVTGGTLDLERSISLDMLDFPGGTITGLGNFTTSLLNWTGGGMAPGGRTILPAASVLNISGLATKTLSRAIDNSGSATWSDGQILADGGTFNNVAGGVFNVSANNSFVAAGGTNAFNNTGAFSKTSSSITIFSVPFNNRAGGTVNVNDGTLVLSGGGVNSGSIDVAAGATARFGGNFVHAASATLTSHGNVDFNTATVSLYGNVTIDGDLSFNSAAATVKANATANKLALVNSTATVAAGGVLSVGPGGIAFGGAAANTVTLQAAAGSPGKLLLGGDVAFTGTDGTAGLNTGDVAVTQTAGLLDLGGATRTFSVNDGLAAVDLAVSAKIANGSIVKGGLGTLRLDSPNTFAGGTKVSAGTLEVIDPAALGSGPVTLSDATLSLRSDAAAPPAFASNVTGDGDATIRVDRISVGTSGVLKLGTVSVGGTRLGVGGANRSLELAGLALSATPTLDVSVPLVVNGPVSQTAPGMGFTKSTGTSKLTLAGTTANTYTGVTRVNAGALELSKPEGVVAVPGDLQVFGGSVKQLAGGQIAQNANLTVANVGTLLDLGGHAQTFASLNVTGGSVSVGATASNGSTGSALLRVNGAFSVTGGGKLDLANNRLVVDYDPAAASPITSVRAALVSGYANAAWNGPGIDSVGIAAGRSLGYAEASDVLGAGGGSFGAATIDGSAVLVRYTLAGDATLDGAVDFNDLVKLAQNYNTTVPATGSGWYRGDFTYDGTVDFSDLVKLAQNYNAALPSEPIAGAPADFESDLAAAFASVPEPGAVSLLAVGVLVAGRRRRAHG